MFIIDYKVVYLLNNINSMKSKEEIEKLILLERKRYNQCRKYMADIVNEKWIEYRNTTNNEDAWLFKQWLIIQLNKNSDK